jgi:MFS family permease
MTNKSKRNYILMFLDTVLFVNAMAFLSVNSVIPYFLNNLGATTFQISLVSALTGIGTFISQPIFSRIAMKLPHKIKTFVKILSIQRIFFLTFVISIPFIASKNPSSMIIIFLICWGIFSFFVGSYSPFFMTIMPKLILNHERGRLLGFAGAVGNLIAVGSSAIIGILLTNIPYPYNYTIIFAIGTILLILDVVDFMLMKNEPTDEHVHRDMSYFQYIKYLPVVLKHNRKYSYMVLGFIFFVVTNVSLAYYSLHAIKNFNAGAAEIAIFTGLALVANTLSSMIFGVIADRFGHKYVLQYSGACGLAAGIIVLSLPGLFSIYTAFALSTICASGYQLSCSMLIIQEAPKEDLPIYISVNVMITLIVSSAFTLLSGYIIDKFSFTPIFFVTCTAGLGAFIVFRVFDNKPNQFSKEASLLPQRK